MNSVSTNFLSSFRELAVTRIAIGCTATMLMTWVLVLSAGCDSTPKKIEREIGSVSLAIDFGSEKKAIETDVVCSPDSTVLQVLERAQNMNEIEFEHRGSGETVFVTSIGGVENDAPSGKYWVYRVNGETGDKSAGIFELKPGDKVSWKYGLAPKELTVE